MTPQEQCILDFLREQEAGAQPIVIAVGVLPQAGQIYSAVHLSGETPTQFVMAAGLGLLSEYRRTMAPDCNCPLCEAIDQALALIHSAGARRLEPREFYQ
ncbi:hypothetical protein UFOVP843_43 [uncultured Caudovirales phage]|uniref:Uncharacterized protein n=1 Tax=uncultured Caudovirales phage TaxID=2100421 RepID=A0A6J5P6F5_9CAUD|nr:hypothetical protein UFOVP843_43 [uncultured Caudovirales phage]CAB4172431.1 hypothetical protein UFOVP936_15 [uncultured Caudovirales phage]